MTTIKDGAGGFGPDNFTVTDINGNPVAAKYLVDSNGNYVLGQNGTPLIVPADYNPNQLVQQFTQLGIDSYNTGDPEPASQAVSSRLDIYQTLITDFRAGGPDDLQRSYNGEVNVADVPAFQAAASYSFGLAAAAAGLTPLEVQLGGGLYNLAKSFNDPSINASGWLGNNPTNVPNIDQGIAAAYSNIFSKSSEQYSVEVYNAAGQQTQLDTYSSSGNLIAQYDLNPTGGALTGQSLFTYSSSGTLLQQTSVNLSNPNYAFSTTTEIGGGQQNDISVFAGSGMTYSATLLGVNAIYDLSGNANTLTTGASPATLEGGGNDTLTSTASGSTLLKSSETFSGGSDASGSNAATGFATFNLSTGWETTDTQFNSVGQETSYETYAGAANSAGNDPETGLITYNGASGAETGAITLSATTGWETSNTEFNSAGQETSYATYAGAANSAGVDPYTGFISFASNGAETSSEQFNSAGVETGVIDYAGTTTNDYETAAITLNATTGWETSDTSYNSAGQETAYETYAGAANSAGIDPTTGLLTFASNGAETSSEQFNSAGVETGVDDYVGNTTDDYETAAITLSTTTGWETSDTQFNSAGQETSYETYGGAADSAGIDPEAGLITFNASTGWEASDTQFNSVGQETAFETYAGAANTAGIDLETGLSTYNVSTGWETSDTQFNTAGQETSYESYAGAADSAGIDPTAGLITYASNGAETSSEQFNSAGVETGVVDYAGTTTNDYETNAISYSATTGWETSDTIYNSAGQVTEVENFAGSENASDVDPETSIATYNPSTGTETGTEPGDGSGYLTASNPFSDGGYDGFSGSYGFAGKQSVVNAALGSDIGSIAQYDLSIGDQEGAAAAEAALHQAQEMANATPTAGTGTAVDSGSKWTGDAITWSLGANMGSQYEAEVQQAFATWAAASGLTFTEVSATSPADIQLGFSELNTLASGVAGYTSYQASAGQLSAATIQLEDPGQDALVAGAEGQLTYSGTNATLEQVLLHEIGHALGLADDSDQDSIMYYELTSTNQTLDSTDIAGIQSLYGSTGNVVQPGTGAVAAVSPLAGGQITVSHQLSQLIAGMASFNPRSAGNTSLIHDDHAHHHMVLAASAH